VGNGFLSRVIFSDRSSGVILEANCLQLIRLVPVLSRSSLFPDPGVGIDFLIPVGVVIRAGEGGRAFFKLK